MKVRCKRVKGYADKGIKVCDEWNNFINFRDWAIKNGYNDSLSIDRIDNNGNYEPSNCRWTTFYIQSRNKNCNVFLTYNGKTQIIPDWAKELNIHTNTIRARYKKRLDS